MLTGLLIVMVLSFAALIPAARAAADSLPGESLYWLKLLIDDARLELIGLPSERVAANMVESGSGQLEAQ